MARPMLNLTTDALCERILGGDTIAIAEGNARLKTGVRPQNTRKLRIALGLDVPSKPRKTRTSRKARTSVPAPAPAPAAIGVSSETLIAAIAQVLAQAEVSSPVAQAPQEPAPVPAPIEAPVSVPAARTDFKAANALAKRVSALKAAERRTLVSRAKAHALGTGMSLADVEVLSDEACLALLAD